MRTGSSLFIFTILFTGLVEAQSVSSQIILDEASKLRLGLVFMRVENTDDADGALVSGQVISSPKQVGRISAQFEGIVEKWQLTPGSTVEAGTLLGAVKSKQVADLQQRWLEASAAFELAHSATVRDEQLFDKGIIAENRLQRAKAEELSVEASLIALESQLALAGYDKASLGQMLVDTSSIGRYRVVATHKGILTHLSLFPGDTVQVGQELAEIAGEALWLKAELPISLAMTLTVGSELNILGSQIKAILRQKDRAVEASTQTIGILAEFEEPTDLLTGQLVSLTLPGGSQGVSVPADAVIHNADLTQVFVRSDQGVDVRSLTLRPLGSGYQVDSGLVAGEEVVIRGTAILKGMLLGLGEE